MAKAKSIKAPKVPAGKRKGIRYKVEPGTLAYFGFGDTKSEKEFSVKHIGLVIEESFRGCGVVMNMIEDIEEGQLFNIKLGIGPVLKAEVRWRKDLDGEVMRLGIMYLD